MFLLMEGLAQRGHRNSVLCREGSASATRAAERGDAVRTASMANTLDLGGVWRMRRHLRELQPDLAILHTGRASWLGGLACKLAGIPAICVRRMDRRVKRSLRTTWIHQSWTQRTVAVSPAVLDCLTAGGVPAQRIVMIADAVDPERLQPQRSAAEVREAQGLEPGRLLLLVLASLDRRKGIDVLLEALSQAAQQLPSPAPMLWVAGNGPEREALHEQCARLGLQDRVRFLGRREDAPDLLGACDVFLLPSRREGLGVAALEAMAVGKPVVASNVGGLGQAVAQDRTGLLVPAEDVTALGNAIARVLEDDELRARLGAAGPAHIAEHYLGSQQVLRYEELFEDVLSELGRS